MIKNKRRRNMFYMNSHHGSVASKRYCLVIKIVKIKNTFQEFCGKNLAQWNLSNKKTFAISS